MRLADKVALHYTTFGRRTGLRVSELALGTGSFGTGWGHGAEPAEARRIFDGYVEAGGNFLDCADGYQNGQAERLVERTSDRELLPMAEGLGLGVTLWSPLGGGFLTVKYRRGETGRLGRLSHLVHSETTPQKTQILDTVVAVAEELGVTPGQVAIAWLLHRAARSSTAVIPILGANTRSQLDDNLAATAVTLSEEQTRRLEAVSAIPLGFPHEMLAPERNGTRIAGGRAELLEPRIVPVA